MSRTHEPLHVTRCTIFISHCFCMFRPHYIAICRELQTTKIYTAYAASSHT